MGVLTKGFGQFQEARELGMQAQSETDPAKKEALLQKREELVRSANLHIATHEQNLLEKPHLFGHPDVKNSFDSIAGTMNIKDPNGTFNLLPNGGNWADYKTRMGYKEVPQAGNGTIDVRNPDGTSTHYQVDPSAKGTISDYFNSRASGPAAAAMSANAPDPLFLPPTSSSGRGMDRLGTDLQTGNVAGASLEMGALPVRLASDGLARGGNLVTQTAVSNRNTASAVGATLTPAVPAVGASLGQSAADVTAATGITMNVVGNQLDRAVNTGTAVTKTIVNTGANMFGRGVDRGLKMLGF